MPEVTTCPDCDKKLKVPDRLIGKKVRCPGCAGMFTAKADGGAGEDFDEVGEEEEASAKAKVGASRKDGITDRKGSPHRDEDEDDRPRSKKDREEDDRPSNRSRRDDEDVRDRERTRSHGVKRRDDLDDRPSRSARDDRPSRSRRDDDEDHERRPSRSEQDFGWKLTRVALLLMMISNWVTLAMWAELTVGGGLIMFFAAGAIMDVMAGEGRGLGQMAGAGALVVIVAVFGFALYCIAKILEMVAMGMSIFVPARRSQALRIMAIVAAGCSIGGLLISMANNALIGSSAINWLCQLLQTAGFICYIVFLKMVSSHVGDDALGWQFLIFMISYFVFGFLAVTVLIVGACAGMGATIGGKDPGDAAARAGTMMVVMCALTLLLIVSYCALITWYCILLQKLRVRIAGHVDR